MGFFGNLFKSGLKNGLKELHMKNYQMLMKQRDRIGLKMVLMVEQVKKHLR